MDIGCPEGSAGDPPRNPDNIPAAIVFGEPPGIPGEVDVAAEAGDVVVHVGLVERPFCALVLTLDAALDLNLPIAAVIDERRRR
jgi:hypothetical protein